MPSPRIRAFVDAILQMCGSQFPRTCTKCGKEFGSFKAFVEGTEPVGLKPDLSDEPDPIGLLSMANCACGSTLALCCEDLEAHEAFNAALKAECGETGRSAIDILKDLRGEIRAKALQA